LVKALQNTWITWRYLPTATVRWHLRRLWRHWQVAAIVVTIAICLPISLKWQSQVPYIASAQVGLSQIRNLAGTDSRAAKSDAIESKPQVETAAPGPAVTAAVLPLASSPTGLASPPAGPAAAAVGLPAPAKHWYNGYAYGHCTYYVASRRPVPPGWGNARNWYWAAQKSGYRVGLEPQVGAIAWTPNGWFGHVALVEKIENGKILVAEMNYAGWNRISRRWVAPSAFKYIY
jgi:hypothetical protein